MKILITGSNGFVGKNLIAELRNQGFQELYLYDSDTDPSLLEEYTQKCEFVFHLAGVNRPENVSEFMEGNFGFTSDLLNLLKKNENKAPVLITSSIQAELDNPYGISKKAGEELLLKYGIENDIKVFVYRLSNLFGKWCRPNYNSVVATFCHNVARGLEIQINDENAVLTLSYIDDVLKEFIHALNNNETREGNYCFVPVTYKIKLGQLAEKLIAFSKNRDTLIMPPIHSDLDKALYGTYLSYLEEDNFSYKLKKSEDQRGWLAEFIKSEDMGQIFVSKTKPGITRGNHWHHTKVEKFLVIQGKGTIRFRNIYSEKVLEYPVCGEVPEVVDIPVGYTHSIVNTGNEDMITLFWASEMLHPERPDTYYVEV